MWTNYSTAKRCRLFSSFERWSFKWVSFKKLSDLFCLVLLEVHRNPDGLWCRLAQGVQLHPQLRLAPGVREVQLVRGYREHRGLRVSWGTPSWTLQVVLGRIRQGRDCRNEERHKHNKGLTWSQRWQQTGPSTTAEQISLSFSSFTLGPWDAILEHHQKWP